jgi:acetyl-CoA acetyltransferase
MERRAPCRQQLGRGRWFRSLADRLCGHAERNGWKPRGRVVSAVNVGDCPTLMLNAPVPAAIKALARAGLAKDDIDIWEINEAFAIVSERFIRKTRS